MARFSILLATLCVAVSSTLAALNVDIESEDSIKAAAALVAEDLLTFYRGDEPGWVPGILPGPPPDGEYYWWHGGAMWGCLIDYRQATGDKKYDDTIKKALMFQVGDDRDYMPANWSASMGNDDQAFWALSSMLAAETAFPDPPADKPQWLALTQAVFNEQTQIERRVNDKGGCHGGLRWQVFSYNNGFNYVNTIAGACYFNIGARLARYTKNETYLELARKDFDFLMRVGYISPQWDVYDGAHTPDCKDINKAQFSYNAALLIQGAAFAWNATDGASDDWKQRIEGLLSRILEIFFVDGVAVEPSCEPGNCNTDMEAFKGFLHRWLGSTAQLAPFTRDRINPILKTSAQAAVKQCTGGTNGRMCGFHWTSGKFDGAVGAAQQMNVLAALTSLLWQKTPNPVTNGTGGTSKGDTNAGSEVKQAVVLTPITTTDRAGAGILTTVIIALALGAFAWMSLD